MLAHLIVPRGHEKREMIMRFILKQIKRLAITGLLLVGVLLAAIPVTYAYMLARFQAMKQKGTPTGPSNELAMVEKRDMNDVFSRLQEIPFKPLRPLALGLGKAALNNSFLLFQNTMRATGGRIYPYPPDFEKVVIESFDGTPLGAVMAVHDDRPRPGLVLSHGFMGSKSDHNIIDSALTAFAGWGFNVLALDLRNFGESQRLSHSPSTPGWKEGEDLLAAARYLGERPGVTSVGMAGFSMGAGSVMRAAYMNREYPYLTGGAIAWNGYADARRMVEYISTKPEPRDPFFPVYLGFRLMHRLRLEDMKRYIVDTEILEFFDRPLEEANFMEYIERVAAPHCGVSAEECYANSSPEEFLADVEVPLLVVHAADDPVCPPSEMDSLMEIAEDNPNVNVWMLPTGSHCLFRYYDKNWYESVMRDFFSYWASWD